MKKTTAFILVLTLILSACMLITGCSKDEQPPQVDNTTHTLPPTQAVTVEPEWAEVNCNIALIDASTNTTIISGEDFDIFAVYGTTDEDSYISIKVTQEATDIINSAQDLSEVQLVINGDTVGDITLKPGSFTGEIAFGHDFPYENLCILASSIRGLY